MFVSNTSAKSIEIEPGVKRKILSYGGSLLLSEIHANKDSPAGKLHNHCHEQLVYVVKGSLRFQCGDKVYAMAVGDSIYIKPDEMHGPVKVHEDIILIEVFVPIREDLIV